LYAGRPSTEIPLLIVRDTLAKNDAYAERLAELRQQIQKGQAVVVYFTEDSEPAFPTIADLEKEIQAPCRQESDGVFCGKINPS
jgi:hypothetical protein